MTLTDFHFATSTASLALQRAEASWEWYVVRAAGFTAVGLLILLMLSGIGQVTGLTFRFVEPIKAWAIHKALAWALCIAIAIHVIFLLLDHFVKFSLVQVLVPFTSHYTRSKGMTNGMLWTAFGVLAMYGVAIIVASSLGWIDRKKGVWKKLHYLSYLTMVLVFFHALYSGSDLAYGLFKETWIAIGVVLLLATGSRLWRAGTLRRSK